MKRRRRVKGAAELEAEANFRETVLREDCLMKRRPGHRCSGPLDAHHVLPKRFLKTNYSTFPDAEKWERIHDPANGVALCRAAHDAVTTRMGYIFLEELPARVVDFARDQGLMWRLERECPPEFVEAIPSAVRHTPRTITGSGGERRKAP